MNSNIQLKIGIFDKILETQLYHSNAKLEKSLFRIHLMQEYINFYGYIAI